MKSHHLRVELADQDSDLEISYPTLLALKTRLNLASDAAVVQYALARLRDFVLMRYPLDEGPVSDETLDLIRKHVNQSDLGGQSLL